MSSCRIFDVVEADLQQLKAALSAKQITSVELVIEYLRRISIYDHRGLRLNSTPIINPAVFEEAAASDDRRAAGACLGPMDGIPYTVKDSYKVAGLTVASGAPALRNLIANEDAFTVERLRAAGAVLLGKTNMPPMAAGGMQYGVYGRAESPYNLEYLAAAFGSGSSNGSAVATAASMAAFGLGEETVSSGRSPASNNALVAYTPSRGNISIRGNWPLYPSCDVVVPHTRTMSDLFGLLDVIASPDPIKTGDFWRNQPFMSLPAPWKDKPASFYDLRSSPAMNGLRIGVPSMYITPNTSMDNNQPYVSPEVCNLWATAKQHLESLGAEVIVLPEFPLVTKYETHIRSGSTDWLGLPLEWKSVERGRLLALAWDEFLKNNKDASLASLKDVDTSQLWPFEEDDLQVCFSKPENRIHWHKLASQLVDSENGNATMQSPMDTPDLSTALAALEAMRKSLLEDWLDENKLDFVVFPANGDVGRADADTVRDSAKFAWTDGVKYSNGNQVLRHLGVPSITVPMGMIPDKKMPIGLTIIGKAYDDVNILRLGYLYEQASQNRVVPPLTPSISIASAREGVLVDGDRPKLHISCKSAPTGAEDGAVEVSVNGIVTVEESTEPLILQIYVDGNKLSDDKVVLTPMGSEPGYMFTSIVKTPRAPEWAETKRWNTPVSRDRIMVVVVARVGANGRPTAWLGQLE